jgi:hypothetical protein
MQLRRITRELFNEPTYTLHIFNFAVMSQRPNRRGQNVFELQDPLVTFEIMDSTHTRITIPANSGWGFPMHWHPEGTKGCERITNLSGRIWIAFGNPKTTGSGSIIMSPGLSEVFKPGYHYSFGPDRDDTKLVVLLEMEPSQILLFRNSCGATLDAYQYPRLSSTPYWLRLLYRTLGFSPRAQRYFVRKMLWIQIQMMQRAHAFCSDHGEINVPDIWWYTHPWRWGEREPQWTFDLMWWTCAVISTVVHTTCYWVGRLLLGMKAEYPEYTPEEGANVEVSPPLSYENEAKCLRLRYYTRAIRPCVCVPR